MKRLLTIALLLAVSFASFAQLSKIPQRNEIVSIEADGDTGDADFLSSLSQLLNGGAEIREVFDSPSEDGAHHYWLSVGHLGFGDDIVQVNIDPAFELFIPLGDNLEEAQKTMESLNALFKQPKNSSMEIKGCLCFGFPNADKLETVTATYRKPLISKMLEFTVHRDGYIRSSHVQKSDFGSLVRGVKFYRKLHPKQ